LIETLHNVWNIQWEHSEVLWGLVVLPLLGALLWYDWWLQRRLGRQWSQVLGVQQRSILPSLRGTLWRTWLLLTSAALAIAGFASPTLPNVVWEPAWERVAMGLLLDVSRSMGAPAEPHDPMSVSRLDLLKQTVQDLLIKLPGGVRVGVIVFAGVAVPLVPEPTADHQAVLAKVRRLHPEFIINPGTALAGAIRQGMTMLVDTAAQEQPAAMSFILLSDGDTVLTPELRTIVQQTPLPIFTLALGAPYPARIPDPHVPTRFLEDQRGVSVTTTSNEALLRFIAAQTGGLHVPFAQRETLSQALRQMIAQQGSQVAQPVPQPQPVRQFCFLGAFCCLLLYQFQTRPVGVWRWRRRPFQRGGCYGRPRTGLRQ
jgi:Ca-activated chloride channel family protein